MGFDELLFMNGSIFQTLHTHVDRVVNPQKGAVRTRASTSNSGGKSQLCSFRV